MYAVNTGQLDVSDGFHEAMNLCLGCLACQTACPAGVEFGHLLEEARDQSEARQKEKRPPWVNKVRHWLVADLLKGPHGLEKWLPLLKIYQVVGLQKLNLGRLLPGPFGDWEQMLPPIPQKSTHQALSELLPVVAPQRGRVGLLTGCLENSLLADMNIATARVLAQNGFDVVIPQTQACCGALSAHIGELDIARDHARKNIEVFEAAKVDVVISDAAGCSAQLKEYGHLLKDDPVYRDRAQYFATLSRDATEFLAEILPLRAGMRKLNLLVAYDDPCHLVHAQGVFLQPRQLIEAIPGIELVELPESNWCCGSAGTYNLTHSKEADILLERKLENLRRLSADVLLTANTGCYIQLSAGVKRFGVDVEVMHIIELIARAYFGAPRGT
jgi:glycolate oxidase iron-sulfur subunit